jgi:carbon-monoxide dehydrogenase medium subunit
MKPPVFSFHSPATVAETVGLLASLENAMLLAGGQSLMPMLNMRYAQPDHVIDLNHVDGLDYISEGGGWLEIGAMTRQRDVEFSREVERRCPLLAEAIPLVGHRQTRNRGTVGGSLSHSDPAAEIPTVCAATDAVLRVQGPKGERDIPFAEFSLGFMTTAMELDEILLSIRIPEWESGHGYAFQEFARRHGDFAIVSAAALLTAGADGRITRASLAVGGAGPAPFRIADAEARLVGQPGSPEIFEAAAEACSEIDAIGDVHAPADYRRQLAAVLARRALETAWSRAVAGPGSREP